MKFKLMLKKISKFLGNLLEDKFFTKHAREQMEYELSKMQHNANTNK